MQSRNPLALKMPIIQAPMEGGATTPALVAAVFNNGGLGSLGAGYCSPDTIRQAIPVIIKNACFCSTTGPCYAA